jgi:MFS superfamily sulfate permease-like transporter
VWAISIPEAVLAASVLFAVSHLFEVHEMKRLYRVCRPEFVIALITLLSVLTFGSLIGLAIGVIFSIILFVGRASRTQFRFWVKIPNVKTIETLRPIPTLKPSSAC